MLDHESAKRRHPKAAKDVTKVLFDLQVLCLANLCPSTHVETLSASRSQASQSLAMQSKRSLSSITSKTLNMTCLDVLICPDMIQAA